MYLGLLLLLLLLRLDLRLGVFVRGGRRRPRSERRCRERSALMGELLRAITSVRSLKETAFVAELYIEM
jgi:hypothetical protein